MASRQQIIHIITEIAVFASISAYFLYRNKVLNEKMKSLEYKIYQQEEIIKKHDTILQSLLSSSNTFKQNNKPLKVQHNNITNFFNEFDGHNNTDSDDDGDGDIDDDDDDHDDKKKMTTQTQTNLQNSLLKTKTEPTQIGKVVITLGEIPNFGFDSILQPPSHNDLFSPKVEEIFDKTTLPDNQLNDIDDTSSNENNSKKKKKKKKKNKKNLTEDELLDLEIENEIQELI